MSDSRNPLTSWLGDRAIGTKISIALVVGVLGAIAVGWAGIDAVSQSNAKIKAINASNIASLDLHTQLQVARLSAELQLNQILIRPTAAEKRTAAEAMRDFDAAHDAAFGKYSAIDHPARERALIGEYSRAITAFRTLRDDRLVPLAMASEAVEYEELYDSAAVPLLTMMNDDVHQLGELEKEDARQSASDAEASGRANRNLIIGLIVGGVIVVSLVGFWVIRLITRGLRQVGDVLTAVADGDLSRQVVIHTKDEVGQMADALNSAMESMRTTVKTIEGAAASLAAASEELTGSSSQIAATAEETSAQAGVVAAAAEEVSRNVQTVAAGSEEMGASIREIAQNANEAANVASHAVTAADTANNAVSKLGESSTEIGNVVKVITSIAEQTNLLALNATIEAARAGEAGKGFAVVANEVKDLAQETARATEDISRRVDAIQSDTGGAVEAIGEISRIIGKINDYQLTISSAVEEQTATTNEMNRSVSEAAAGSSEIAANIHGVATAAQMTTESVADAQRASEELARMSGELQSLIGRFRA